MSPAHRLLKGGWEGSQRSFPLTQQPLGGFLGQGTSMWHWPLCKPASMPLHTVKALCTVKKGALWSRQ